MGIGQNNKEVEAIDLYLKVQKTGEIKSEHPPLTLRVLAASGDWIALEWWSFAFACFQRSTGLQENRPRKIIEGIEQVPQEYFASSLSDNERESISRHLKTLNAS